STAGAATCSPLVPYAEAIWRPEQNRTTTTNAAGRVQSFCGELVILFHPHHLVKYASLFDLQHNKDIILLMVKNYIKNQQYMMLGSS
ncbi:MAG: hypothetical protein ACI8RD_010147, partial [Bacillariaceae sp.]